MERVCKVDAGKSGLAAPFFMGFAAWLKGYPYITITKSTKSFHNLYIFCSLFFNSMVYYTYKTLKILNKLSPFICVGPFLQIPYGVVPVFEWGQRITAR